VTDEKAAPPVVAFYLPQFHPVPDNDAWWGQGFTEWRKVVKGQPLFEGHYQPHMPADLGFYDLRLPEVRWAQAALAREYGIAAFCYYHYWFKGRRILERPFNEVLKSGEPDFPFCLCWANENWTTRWDAGNQHILLAQEYDEADDRDHVRYLIEAFADPRYLRINGRPLLCIYRIQGHPAPQRTLDMWRKEVVAAGLPEPFIVKFDTHGNWEDPARYGCDAAAEFLPHGVWELVPPSPRVTCAPGNQVRDYRDVASYFSTRTQPEWTRYPCVAPGWDNTSRVGDGRAGVFDGTDPDVYETWLRVVRQRVAAQPDEGVVFVNAWNEWAEGAHLEPDERFGRRFLEATGRVVHGSRRPTPLTPPLTTEPTSMGELYTALYQRSIRLERAYSEYIARAESELARARSEHSAALHECRDEASRLADYVSDLEAKLRTARVP
jgi:hypothetical protein